MELKFEVKRERKKRARAEEGTSACFIPEGLRVCGMCCDGGGGGGGAEDESGQREGGDEAR